MIKKLRRKFNVLVLVGLFVLLSLTYLSINALNWHFITEKAENSLQILSEAGGRRPSMRRQGRRPEHFYGEGQPRDDEHAASMYNSYMIRLEEDGSVRFWYSDREDLYSDEQIRELADAALASGERTGRVGSQFWQMNPRQNGKLLVVLDARMEVESARRLMQTTATVGVLTYLLMGMSAVLLIRRMTKPAQEAFDKQKQFVWDASHELKTPLAVISANAEVLAGEIGENEWLGYIRSEVKRTDNLVQHLLTLARMDRDGLPAAKKKVNLSQAVLQVALPFESTVYEAGKTIYLQVEENVHCMGDEAMLQQLAVILLSNAEKYSDEKGCITLKLEKKGEHCVLSVHNTGEPIAPEALPHIFDRFYRGDSSHNRENPGNGLGLSIAKNIVTAHKGKITVESSAKEGTCFTVTI